uniref:Uncharacterized protein n=1 Tax=Cacopsylla melanoneura TaxID=428564 RepID=A0A8D8LUR3_9HEMI
MKLRNRAKDNENSKRPVDDDNEEDVDDPEVDSDSDPEWGTESEEKNEMFSMKRKSFVPIPLQMQQPPAKLKKIEPITSTSSSNSETPKAGPSGVTQKSPATDKKRNTPTTVLYKDKTFQQSKSTGNDWIGDEEIERENMYSEFELLLEMGIGSKQEQKTLGKNSLQQATQETKSNRENLSPNTKRYNLRKNHLSC